MDSTERVAANPTLSTFCEKFDKRFPRLRAIGMHCSARAGHTRSRRDEYGVFVSVRDRQVSIQIRRTPLDREVHLRVSTRRDWTEICADNPGLVVAAPVTCG